jgi:single-strand DNA-binding protein
MWHQIQLAGRLTRDAEGRYTPDGKYVANMNIAVDSGYGENKKTMWVKGSMFGERAEKIGGYLLKGKPVLITGRLSMDSDGNPRTWVDQQGKTHASFEVIVNDLIFLPDKKREGEAEPGSYQDEVNRGNPQPTNHVPYQPVPADVPF